MMRTLEGSLLLRIATAADAELLASLGEATFRDTFALDNSAADMAMYVASAFGVEMQRAELADPRCVVLVAEREGTPVGYAMLRTGPSPDGVRGADPIEIARLYAVKQMVGTGIGAALMQGCLDHAVARGHATIWLGVWEHNARAIAFYKRWGFSDVGSQSFMLGRDRQMDHVMMRSVREGF